MMFFLFFLQFFIIASIFEESVSQVSQSQKNFQKSLLGTDKKTRKHKKQRLSILDS